MGKTQAGSGKVADAGVVFPEGQSGSALLSRLMSETIGAHPAAFGAMRVPRGKAFRSGYGELVARFESLRAASAQRAAIALFATRRQLETFEYLGERGRTPLLAAFEEPAEPLPLQSGAGAPPAGAVVEVPYLGRSYRGAELAGLARGFVERHVATHAAARALAWIGERADPSGALDLRGESLAVLGAAAEIAPTAQLIRGGARVLWIDVQEPPAELRCANVQWAPGGADLLAQPARIARTIEAFAGGRPVRLAAYAYAPGRGREWRLAVAMNAIAHRLPRGLASSLSMLLSPTTPAVVQPEDLEALLSRKSRAPLWQRALAGSGFLGPAHLGGGSATVVRAVVAAQGPTYQAAQYAAKRLAAEAFAAYGAQLDERSPAPLLVSANVAPITRTRSLQHPVFEAGFLGAPRFGVEIFDPAATRALGAMLTLHDLLNPASPSAALRDAAQAGSIFTEQIHGGIFGMPWALDPAIAAAAVLGLGQRPKLLLRMLR